MTLRERLQQALVLRQQVVDLSEEPRRSLRRGRRVVVLHREAQAAQRLQRLPLAPGQQGPRTFHAVHGERREPRLLLAAEAQLDAREALDEPRHERLLQLPPPPRRRAAQPVELGLEPRTQLAQQFGLAAQQFEGVPGRRRREAVGGFGRGAHGARAGLLAGDGLAGERRLQRGLLGAFEVGRGLAPALGHLLQRRAALQFRDDVAELAQAASVVDDPLRRVRHPRRPARLELHLGRDLASQLQPADVEAQGHVVQGHDAGPAGARALVRETLEPAHAGEQEVLEERVGDEQRVRRRPRPDEDVLCAAHGRASSRERAAGASVRSRSRRCRPAAHGGILPLPPSPPSPAGHAMSIITFNNVEKSFAGQRLFTTVTFSVDGHDHAVLVGRNGTGKTTLLRLISGDEHADSGAIARARGRRIWLHEQTPELERDRPVREYLVEAFGEAVELEAALRATEERLSGLAEHSPELRDTMKSYQQLQRRFEAAGGYGYRDRLGSVVEGLGLPEDDARARPALPLRRRAHARHAGTRAARRRRPAAAGRAHQPPRHRLGGVAGGVPLRLRARLPAGHPRPPPAGEGRAAGVRGGARARRDAGRRLRDLPQGERGAPRPHAPRVRAGPREDRAAAAVLRPLPRQEGQGQAGQGQADADRAHQGGAAGAAQAEAELQAGAPAAQAVRARGARAEGAGGQRRLRRRRRRRPHPRARRRRRARARREGRPARRERIR